MIPVDHLLHALQTPVQGTARVHLSVVRRHHIALFDDILHPQFKRIHMQLRRQFVHGGLHREKSLGGTVSAVSTGGHHVCIHDIADEAECLRLSVKRDGFMSGKSHGRRSMFPVGAGVGQRVHVDSIDDSVLAGAETHMNFHLVTRGGSCHALLAGEDDLRRLLCHPCHVCRVDFADGSLLRAEAAADSRLADADHGLWNMQSVRQDPSAVEHDLGGAHHIQSTVGVDGAESPERLHHGLLTCFRVVDMVDDHVAVL